MTDADTLIMNIIHSLHWSVHKGETIIMFSLSDIHCTCKGTVE